MSPSRAEHPGQPATLHWDGVYRHGDPAELSWYQREPAVSLELLDALGAAPGDGVVDVGGGLSPLAGKLLDRGFRDVTVLDVAETALTAARARLGGRAGLVTWVGGDVRSWRPDRHFAVWHDRALFHFFVEADDRARYVESLRRALAPGGGVVIASFASDGPERCSGLPVVRYDVAGLAAALGPGFELVDERREEHVTPAGRVQPFTWAAFRAGA